MGYNGLGLGGGGGGLGGRMAGGMGGGGGAVGGVPPGGRMGNDGGRPHNYRTKPCRYFEMGMCKNGDQCTFLHPGQMQGGGGGGGGGQQEGGGGVYRSAGGGGQFGGGGGGGGAHSVKWFECAHQSQSITRTHVLRHTHTHPRCKTRHTAKLKEGRRPHLRSGHTSSGGWSECHLIVSPALLPMLTTSARPRRC